MNQFKVGDTVWTVKRGKGRIVSNHIEHTGYRPFNVMFEGYAYSRSPKLSNLYRTEAEMIEAKNKAKCYGTANFLPPLSDTITIRDSYDPFQPKFKLGDKVYYEGKKWSIRRDYMAFCLVPIEKQTEYGSTRGTYVIESNLRLWKEHEFTHIAAGNEPKGMDIRQITDWDKRNINPSAYKSVTYLGVSASKMDTFHCVTNEGTSVIIYGKKGDIEI